MPFICAVETVAFNLEGEDLILDPRKAIWWPAQKALLIADLHLGKASHFRRKGIAVPEKASAANFMVLKALLDTYQPGRVLFLGDLFHSEKNREWGALGGFIFNHQHIRFELVAGNHDILSPSDYAENYIHVYPESLVLGPFLLTHEPLEKPSKEGYNLAGHIHPGVLLRGQGRQAMRLPCFYFGQAGGILPAFGAFTGFMRLRPSKKDQVFVVVEDRVLQV